MSTDSLTILHYALSFFPVTGGMTTRIYNLIRNDGNTHIMVSPKSPSDYIPADVQVTRSEDRYDNIQVNRCPLKPITPGRIPILDYRQVWKIRKQNADALVQRGPDTAVDLMYGHGPIDFAMAAANYAERHSVPLIFEVHSIIQDNLWTGNGTMGAYHRFMNRPAIKLERRVLNQARALIVQTGSIGRRVRELYGVAPEKIHVLYNGVDIQRFQPTETRPQALDMRESLPLKGRTLVLYAGLLDEINGIRFFLDTYPMLPDHLQQRLFFCFAGRGEYAKQVQELADRCDNVHFFGMVEYEKMPAMMSAADIFFIPRPSSLPSETLMPVKLLEVMAMETDVLVSDVGGMLEVVQDGVTGYTFPKDDPAGFIASLETVVANQAAGKFLGQAARESVARRFSWQSSRDELARIYAEVRRPQREQGRE